MSDREDLGKLRHPDREYKHRRGDREFRRRQADHLIGILEDHIANTDPEKGEPTAVGKDLTARWALIDAGKLVDLFAGWAVDHVVGRATTGKGLVPFYPSTSRQHPDLIAERAEADSHEHERVGTTQNRGLGSLDYDAHVMRTTLLELVETNSGALPFGMKIKIAEALRALAFGEVLPVFAPDKNDRAKRRYLELKSQLRALEHVEYRFARGMRRLSAQEEVADKFGVSRETVISWGKRIREDLGDLHVADRLQRAKLVAIKAKENTKAGRLDAAKVGDELYGAEILQRDAEAARKLALRETQPSRCRKRDLRT